MKINFARNGKRTTITLQDALISTWTTTHPEIETESQLTNKLKHTALNINNGIEKVVILRGEILIPVSDEDVEQLRQNKGCATILDGGMVWIKGLVNGDHLSIEGFEKVGEISTEKY